VRAVCKWDAWRAVQVRIFGAVYDTSDVSSLLIIDSANMPE